MPEEGDPDYDPEYEVDQDFQAPGQTGGEKEHQLMVEELPEHDHSSNLRDWKADGNTPSGGSGLRGHPGEQANEERTGITGDNQPHNNLQPYYCVYIWKRTA